MSGGSGPHHVKHRPSAAFGDNKLLTHGKLGLLPKSEKG